MPNQNQDQDPNTNDRSLPIPPVEIGPEGVTPPTLARTAPPIEEEEQIPADVKEANRTSQIPLFLAMGILAIILFALLAYF